MITISDELKALCGKKVLKLSLTSGCTCPNRDGRVGTGGCAFCSEGGSGEFAAPLAPIDHQIAEAKKRVDAKFPKSLPENERAYVAYFQSFTNTYGETERLRTLYGETISRPEIAALSIGTRPDCLEGDKLVMLKELAEIKPVWVELGLQTIHEETAAAMNRGYRLEVFDEACHRLKEAGVTVIVHVILGLPGEIREMMLDTVRYVGEKLTNGPVINGSGCGPARGCPDGKMIQFQNGIKLQNLQVLKGTELGRRYAREPFPLMTLQDYTKLTVDCLRLLPPDITIHRLTGDPPKNLLIAPAWCGDKKRTLNTLARAIREAGL